MTDIERKNLTETYLQLLNQQEFRAEELDYAILEKHKPMLKILAETGNSGVSIFDSFKKEHVFYSPDFGKLLGYDARKIEEQDFLDSKIHPEDLLELTRNGISLLKLYYRLSKEEKENYKLINEYRIMNAEDQYIRVIEQHQVLESDAYGNIWLTLSIIDVSPDQEISVGLKSKLLNYKTGKFLPFGEENTKTKEELSVALTQREKQVLQMVRDGLLSKEISDKLSISVHTVNTHRQRVLEKLGANNSMEAVVYASGLGLL